MITSSLFVTLGPSVDMYMFVLELRDCLVGNGRANKHMVQLLRAHVICVCIALDR